MRQTSTSPLEGVQLQQGDSNGAVSPPMRKEGARFELCGADNERADGPWPSSSLLLSNKVRSPSLAATDQR